MACLSNKFCRAGPQIRIHICCYTVIIHAFSMTDQRICRILTIQESCQRKVKNTLCCYVLVDSFAMNLVLNHPQLNDSSFLRIILRRCGRALLRYTNSPRFRRILKIFSPKFTRDDRVCNIRGLPQEECAMIIRCRSASVREMHCTLPER